MKPLLLARCDAFEVLEPRAYLSEHERKGGEVFRRFAALAREAS